MHTRAQHVKSKANSITKRIALGVASSAAAVGLVVLPVAAATSIVTDSSTDWVKTEQNGGTISYVASPGALGTGAAQFTTPTDASYTRLRKDVNMKLSDITNLSYMTKQVSVPSSAQNVAAVNLRLYIDTTGGTTFNDVLVYEPYYNGAVSTGWQTWTASQSTGYWWSNSGLTYNGHASTGAGSYATNFNLSDVLASYPNTTVVSVGLGTGDYNSPWTVQADALTVNDTTYNFENEPAKVTVTNKDQCKDNGWTSVYAFNGASFKNQGACVSYVASNGKSQH